MNKEKNGLMIQHFLTHPQLNKVINYGLYQKKGDYIIEVWGARGGKRHQATGQNGGYGARMKGTFNLMRGEVLKIVVGQMGFGHSI